MAEVKIVIVLRGQWWSCCFCHFLKSKCSTATIASITDVPFQSLRPHTCQQAAQALAIMVRFSSYCWQGARICVLQDESLTINFLVATHELAATVFRARESTATGSGRAPSAHICSLCRSGHKRFFVLSLELCG